MLAVDPEGKQDLIMVVSKLNGSTHRRSKRFGGRGHPRISSKAIPKNKLTGGSQPPILRASESFTPPELGAGGLPVYSIVRNGLTSDSIDRPLDLDRDLNGVRSPNPGIMGKFSI